MPLKLFTSRRGGLASLWVAFPLMMFGWSCAEDEPAGPTATTFEMVVVSGDQQTGTVGEELMEPLVVELRDGETGKGIGNRPVSITVETGMGSVSGLSGGAAAGDGATLTTQTDAAGGISVTLGLGPEAGVQIFSVHTSVDVAGDSLVRVFAIAAAGSIERVVKSGDGQVGSASSALPLPIAVLLSDRFGNPVSGIPVGFEVTSGGGTVSEATVTTDEFGSAAVEWTLGVVAGQQLVSAVVDGVGTFRFEALAQ